MDEPAIAIATSNEPLTEDQAARMIGISPFTLARERKGAA